MKSHMKLKHPNIYKRYLSREHSKEKQSSDVPKFVSSHSHLQSGGIEKHKHKITNYGTLTPMRASISVTRVMLLRALLSKVTSDGRPFSSLHDVSFSTFSEPAMKALNIHYDSKNIADLVEEAAQFIKEKLKSDIENSLVCVKVDCVTRQKKSFIGINIQLVKNGGIVVYTLAVREIKVRHTGENLKKIILQELESFGIQPKHIYTITSDNGSNVVKAVRLIEEEQIKELVEDDNDIAINDGLMENISNAVWESEHIISIRCAAHVLQLCIVDTLKNSWSEPDVIELEIIDTYLDVIERARKVVTELRTQTVMMLLDEQNLKKPSLDVPTRWSSTYTMLSSLLPLKEFCVSCARHGNSKLQLTEDQWKLTEEIRLCLEPSYLATKKIQYQNNTLTDIYKIWNMCHMKTADIELQQERQTELSSDTDLLTDDDEDCRYEKLLKRKHSQKS